jgi:hypothetical protein
MDIHKYKFLYGGKKEYAAGWDRIFGKKKKVKKTKKKAKRSVK